MLAGHLARLRPRLASDLDYSGDAAPRNDLAAALARAQRTVTHLAGQVDMFDDRAPLAEGGEMPIADRIVLQTWVADQAVRDALLLSNDADPLQKSLRKALDALRAARGAALCFEPAAVHVRQAAEHLNSR